MLLLLSGCLMLSTPPDGADKVIWLTPARGPWVSVATAEHRLCAVNEEGRHRCLYLDLGDSPYIPQTVVDIDAHDSDICWVYTGGGAGCSSFTDSLEDDAPERGRFVRVSTSDGSACAFDADDNATCWGDNSSSRVSRLGEGPFTSVAFMRDFSVGVRPDGRLTIAGEPPYDWDDFTFQQGVEAVASDGYYLCAVSAERGACMHYDYESSSLRGGRLEAGGLSGHVYCAQDAEGRLNCEGDNDVYQTSPPENAAFTDFDVSDAYGCGITLEGRVRCWGDVDSEFPFE